MTLISPAVLTDNPETYKDEIERLSGIVDTIHIDYSDGEFAPTFTIGPDSMWWPKEWKATIHAMVSRPSEHIDSLIALKPDLIILHAEAAEDITPSLKKIQGAGIRAGVALLRSTVPMQVKPLLETADHVMIFSGDLGRHGGKASLMQLEKIRLIRAIRPSVEIGWDGGVTIDNAFSLAQGGVDVLYIGGAFAKSSDPKKTYSDLVHEISKRSVI